MLYRWDESHVLLSVRSVLVLDTSAIRLHPAPAFNVLPSKSLRHMLPLVLLPVMKHSFPLYLTLSNN